jgi:hypothetical protein
MSNNKCKLDTTRFKISFIDVILYHHVDYSNNVSRRLEALGFVAWKIERHVGSDCCLDIRYVENELG